MPSNAAYMSYAIFNKLLDTVKHYCMNSNSKSLLCMCVKNKQT